MGSWPLSAVAREVQNENNATAGSHEGDCRFEFMTTVIRKELNESLGACVVGAARRAAAMVEVHVSTWTLLSTNRVPWPVPARSETLPVQLRSLSFTLTTKLSMRRRDEHVRCVRRNMFLYYRRAGTVQKAYNVAQSADAVIVQYIHVQFIHAWSWKLCNPLDGRHPHLDLPSLPR
jgi:hypothetical protein